MWAWFTRLGLGRREEQVRRELEEEIDTHVELRTHDLIARGFEPDDARRQAEARFGDDGARQRLHASALAAEGRQNWTGWLESISADLRVALRRVREAPAFAAVTVATFALAIGLTTAVFTVLDHALLRPLPFPEPERLVALDSVPEAGTPFPYVSMPNWVDWRQQNRTLEATALYYPSTATMEGADGGERVVATSVMGPYFDVLRPPMLAGRPFTEQEAQSEQPVAVISERLWRRALDADPELGELRFNGGPPTQIVGVLESRHSLVEGSDVWLPRQWRAQVGRMRNNINWYAVARLRPGVVVSEARADLDRIAETIRLSDPEGIYSWGVGVEDLRARIVDDTRQTLLLLMAAVLTVLVIGCANLAGQSFARNSASRQTVAVRIALGASRARVVQLHIVEHLLLAIAGGGVGMLVALALTKAAAAAGAPLPRSGEILIDLRIFLFGLAVSGLAGLAAGIAPALSVSRAAPTRAMGHRGAVAGGRGVPGSFLVAAEVALAVVLLIGGGLLVRSFASLTSRDLGFEPSGVVSATVPLTGPAYRDDSTVLALWSSLVDESAALPGVDGAAIANATPGTGVAANGFIEVEGWDDARTGANYRVVSSRYFDVLGMPLAVGREFDDRDARGAERVAIVTQQFVDTYWPGENGLGRRVRAISMEAPESPWLTIVGVVPDARYGGFATPPSASMYVHYEQVPHVPRAMTVVAKVGRGDAAQVQRQIRDLVRARDAGLATELGTMSANLEGLLTETRLVMNTLVVFATLAVALALLGLHSLLAFQVARRRKEMAVRTALGAQRSSVVGSVLGDATVLAGIGIAVGLLVAWWTSRTMASLLVDIEPNDPLTFAFVGGAILLVSVLAAALPAWNAARQNPVDALRG